MADNASIFAVHHFVAYTTTVTTLTHWCLVSVCVCVCLRVSVTPRTLRC